MNCCLNITIYMGVNGKALRLRTNMEASRPPMRTNVLRTTFQYLLTYEPFFRCRHECIDSVAEEVPDISDEDVDRVGAKRKCCDVPLIHVCERLVMATIGLCPLDSHGMIVGSDAKGLPIVSALHRYGSGATHRVAYDVSQLNDDFDIKLFHRDFPVISIVNNGAQNDRTFVPRLQSQAVEILVNFWLNSSAFLGTSSLALSFQIKHLLNGSIGFNEDPAVTLCHFLCGQLLNAFFGCDPLQTSHYCRLVCRQLWHRCHRYHLREVLIAFLAELENDTIGGETNAGATTASTAPYGCDHNVFKAILKPLECVLIQLPTKRNETLKWVLSTLNAHISRLSVDTIDDYQFEGEEKQFIDNDVNAKQINNVLPLYISFIQTFVNEVDVTKRLADGPSAPLTNGNCKTSDPHIQRTILLKALLRLLDHPLLHLDLSEETNGESRELAVQVVKLISRLQSNYYVLFERIDLITSNKKLKNSDNSDIELSKDVFVSAMANLSYLVHSESIGLCGTNFVPCIYTHVYVFGVHLQFIDVLLKSSVCLIYEKGLYLAQQLLSQINDCELEAHFLDLIRSIPIEKSLINIMVYSSVESHRKRALNIFRRLIVSFDSSGRYKILLSILSQPQQHSGLQGLVIGIYKDFMFTSELFLGHQLQRMMKLAIKSSLPEGVATDLLEQNDTIFATLNIVRYVCIKDNKTKNETKLWDIMPFVKDQLLRPLHKALDLSRAHYKLELCKLKEQKTGGSSSARKKSGPKVEVRIGGQKNGQIPNLPVDHKHKIVLLALQNFDLIEMAKTLSAGSNTLKSASAPKASVPFRSSMPNTCAACSVAHSMASTVVQPVTCLERRYRTAQSVCAGDERLSLVLNLDLLNADLVFTRLESGRGDGVRHQHHSRRIGFEGNLQRRVMRVNSVGDNAVKHLFVERRRLGYECGPGIDGPLALLQSGRRVTHRYSDTRVHQLSHIIAGRIQFRCQLFIRPFDCLKRVDGLNVLKRMGALLVPTDERALDVSAQIGRTERLTARCSLDLGQVTYECWTESGHSMPDESGRCLMNGFFDIDITIGEIVTEMT
ncbi:unnamed protein product [Medioppia subpectinata]|uniref:Uncharacterized protein n=1 Tax=Medioppia subpectinata TaxID=1979941 RepID=A0A7R9KXQ0_9ACAR|nr:unnamed protein product [Medioppia subpectinata]CAG2111431.1 unnamed protein product [Medioppia subpectinata]